MTPSELEALEHDALEHLAEEEGHVEADLEAGPGSALQPGLPARVRRPAAKP